MISRNLMSARNHRGDPDGAAHAAQLREPEVRELLAEPPAGRSAACAPARRHPRNGRDWTRSATSSGSTSPLPRTEDLIVVSSPLPTKGGPPTHPRRATMNRNKKLLIVGASVAALAAGGAGIAAATGGGDDNEKPITGSALEQAKAAARRDRRRHGHRNRDRRRGELLRGRSDPRRRQPGRRAARPQLQRGRLPRPTTRARPTSRAAADRPTRMRRGSYGCRAAPVRGALRAPAHLALRVTHPLVEVDLHRVALGLVEALRRRTLARHVRPHLGARGEHRSRRAEPPPISTAARPSA